MPKIIDLVGQRFYRLIVLERDMTKIGKAAYWICKCDCGTIKSIRGDSLRNGKIKSCGCLQKELAHKKFLENLVGQKFGRLEVLREDYCKNNNTYWVCKCDCGKIVSVNSKSLKNKHTQSCGCYQKEKASQANIKILIGQKFGRLTVLERDFSRDVFWKCLCDCGNITTVKGTALTSGNTKSCGCLNSKGELRIEDVLKTMPFKYKKQYTFSDLQGEKNLLKFDFAIFKNDKLFCLIEYQGQQHYNSLEIFGGEEQFQKQKKYDIKKQEYCKKNNIKLIEIPYWDYNKINKKYLEKILGE